MSPNRPSASVVPTNPTAGVARTGLAYGAAIMIAAPINVTHVSFSLISASLSLRSPSRRRADTIDAQRAPFKRQWAECRTNPQVAVECRPLPSRGGTLQFAPRRTEPAMARPFDDASPPTEPEGRLDSWKEIATYLNRDVTTVQRWEKREAMPVHRHQHDRMGSVYAFRTELDAWVRSRNLRSAQETPPAAPAIPEPSPRRARSTARPFVLGLAAVGVVVAAATGLWLRETEFFWRNPIA